MDAIYSDLQKRVRADGYFVQEYPGRNDQLILMCSSMQYACGSFGGNSFRVEFRSDSWRIVTWAGPDYRVPKNADMACVAMELLERKPEQAYGAIPSDIVNKHALMIESDDDEDN